MLLIGCDIDGVLCEVQSVIRDRAKSDFNIELSKSQDWISDEDLEGQGLPKKWLWASLFKDEWFWSKAMPEVENIETLQRWAREGAEIHIVTGRPKELCGLVTINWLRRHGVMYRRITFEQVMHKVKYLKENSIAVMFEDRFYEANKIASFGIKTFMPRRPWNIEFADKITNPLLTYVDLLSDADSWIKEHS